jgi:agmatine deiminase
MAGAPLQRTPRELGYRMPAEWERHRATWLAWPENEETWPGRLEEVRRIWERMIALLAAREDICLLVRDAEREAAVAGRLRAAGARMERVSFYRIPTVDAWIRDYGPTFLVHPREKRLALCDWVFNAWGGKYPGYPEDERAAREIARSLGVPVFAPDFVLEGGAIDVNGAGVCLTTEQCLLNPNRNPGMSKAEIERHLRDYLGVERVVWLAGGIAGDDTDGHVDDVARFVSASRVVCVLADDPADEDYEVLRENYDRLKGAADARGRALEVVALPTPGRLGHEGGRLPASYANFYIANGLVLVPTYGHANDAVALGLLADCFPGSEIVGIPCVPLVAGLGAIHCVTQQEPAAR